MKVIGKCEYNHELTLVQKIIEKANKKNLLFFKCSYYILQDCDDGTFGEDCNSTCGHCVYEETCFHINGTCLDGCVPGFIGEQCKTRMCGLL